MKEALLSRAEVAGAPKAKARGTNVSKVRRVLTKGVNGYPGARVPVACSVIRAVEMRMEARLTLHGRE